MRLINIYTISVSSVLKYKLDTRDSHRFFLHIGKEQQLILDMLLL